MKGLKSWPTCEGLIDWRTSTDTTLNQMWRPIRLSVSSRLKGIYWYNIKYLIICSIPVPSSMFRSSSVPCSVPVPFHVPCYVPVPCSVSVPFHVPCSVPVPCSFPVSFHVPCSIHVPCSVSFQFRSMFHVSFFCLDCTLKILMTIVKNKAQNQKIIIFIDKNYLYILILINNICYTII